MRETYSLTDATHDTLTDNVKPIANAWNKSLRHVYKVLAEETNDPFAMFLSLYQAACKAGVTTSHWDSELEFLRQKFIDRMPAANLASCFAEKLRDQNRTIERYVEAAQDGEWTLDEVDELENALLAESDAIKMGLRSLKLKREKLEQMSGPRLVS